MAKAIQEFNKTVGKYNERLEALKQANEKDQAQLDELQATYEQAVLEEDAKATDLHSKVSKLQAIVDGRDAEIGIIERNMDPIRQKAIQKVAAEFEKKADRREAELKKIYDTLEKEKAAYAKKAVDLHEKADELNRELYPFRTILQEHGNDEMKELARRGTQPGSFSDSFVYSARVTEGTIWPVLRKRRS